MFINLPYDSEKVFFTSDPHFGHSNIIKYCNRPFDSVEEMDESLITSWNNKVPEDGIVFCTGDIFLCNKSKAFRILSRLNGEIHLIEGNHDKVASRLKSHFASYQEKKEIVISNQKIVLCHYAMRVWNQSHRGSWMLYGHSHSTLKGYEKYKTIDIGVDNSKLYCPFSFSEINNIMESREILKGVDAHGTGNKGK